VKKEKRGGLFAQNRIERGDDLGCNKKEKGGGSRQNCISSSSRQNRGSRPHMCGRPVVGGGPLGHNDGRERGNAEKRSRATHSGPHLGLGQLVKRDRRRQADCGSGDTGSGGGELGWERC
jgi:hypothetical protein